MLKRYKTIIKESKGELEEKKSKFIAHVYPIESEGQASEWIESIQKEHNSANHNVYAYVLGQNDEVQRYSDDGEPSGTAGLPILDLLKGESIKNTLIIVTRYFGGTLLGTGGLVRAYTHCAKEGLNQNDIVKKILSQEVDIEVDYTLLGKLQYHLNENIWVHIMDTEYLDNITFRLLIEEEALDAFTKSIRELSSGKLQPILKEKKYIVIQGKTINVFKD
ncbi:putative YigZ family protein [Natranaerovirga hydrolytica]|uniref:Putative YigZ family protein n=1 Tax=Natranaerovirga hydrolytica TaxID=680378 RepID=A0A4R1MIG9_9FIRM|nr:YigZ family protein [Natranaerovirga hydrolytica]TCK92426.1 putative YigZ family protein [Natranaerovirga hydrolytica]